MAQATINGIPVYNALIDDENDGMICISLVDDPAVMSNFVSFDKDEKPRLYEILSEEKRLVRGCVMRADFPIYRYQRNIGEYYIIYRADTIRRMAEKYLYENRQNVVDLMHDGKPVEGVSMVQFFIKGDGVSINGFDSIADGSLFAEFHVLNDDVWQEVKAGTYKGFSLEGYFTCEPAAPQDMSEEEKALREAEHSLFKIFKMGKLTRIVAALEKMLLTFGKCTTDKGVLSWDGSDDIKQGDIVYITEANGEEAPAPDGEYTAEDGRVFVVQNGKLAEIRDAAEPQTDPDPQQDPQQTDPDPATEPDEPDDTDELKARIAELEAENKALRKENDELKARIAELEQMSAAQPAHQQVVTDNNTGKTGDKGLDALARIMSR